MEFSKNLQYLRQTKGYTQEELAEQLQVSRQSVSKWESSGSYPEMEKLIQLSEIFQCNLDVLLKGDAKEECIEDASQYDLHMNQYSKAIAFGVGFILFGTAVYEFLVGVGVTERFVNMIFGAMVVVSVMVFVVYGLRNEEFKRRFPEVGNCYTEKEINTFHKKYISLIAAGIGLILIGLIYEMGIDGVLLPSPFTEDFLHGIFMTILTIAVTIIVYAGLQKQKYNIKKYNAECRKEKQENEKIGKISAVIMLLMTIVFLLGGFLFNAWRICWIAFPVGGIMCGIAAVIFSKEESDEPK